MAATLDQTIFASFQKPIDNIVWLKWFVWIQFFYDFDLFFITTAEQCINIKYVAPKMSFKSAENEIRKNLLIKNHVLFSKNVVDFLSTPPCAFLINVGIFNNLLKTWLLILICLIKRHNFFYLWHLYQSFCEISKFLFCIWSSICNHLYENKSIIFFYFVNQWTFDAVFSFF